MRTQTEILERIERLSIGDLFGFETSDLIASLPYEQAKPYLNADVRPEQWMPDSLERDDIIQRMKGYMPFAWEKANNCRGISAARSLAHFMSWLWLAGDDLGDLLDYQWYGKDQLRKICEHYGWDADQWDDGVRTNG